MLKDGKSMVMEVRCQTDTGHMTTSHYVATLFFSFLEV